MRDGGEPASYTAKRAAADGHAALSAAQALISGSDGRDLARTLELARMDQAWVTVRTIIESNEDNPELLLKATQQLVRLSKRRDEMMGLSSSAEAPPNPEADDTDELRERREKRLREAAGAH